MDFFSASTYDSAGDQPSARAGGRVIGIDPPSMDYDLQLEMHKMVLDVGGVIGGNLITLQKLPDRWAAALLPSRLNGVDGSPTRAVAFCEAEGA